MSNKESYSDNPYSEEEWSEIEESMLAFAACPHVWVKEPIDSIFEYICQTCGGAQGIRPGDDY